MPEIGDTAPDFTLPSTSGRLVRLEQMLGKVVLIDFWAAWCGPCRMMAPEFAKAAKTLKGKARFIKLDTEAFPQAGGTYGIRGIPLLIAFRSGREIARQAGAMPASGIVDWITGAAGK